MIRRSLPSLLLAIFLITTASGQDAEKNLVSGPQDGAALPGPCEVFNINNGDYKKRFHCLVCEYGTAPVVMIFTKEPRAGEDGVFNDLIRRLDAAMEQNQESRLHAFAVVLSSDFRTSATEEPGKEDDKVDREKLKKDAEIRDELLKRLDDRASSMKSVVLACTVAEGPKSYNLNPKAEVTVVFYEKLKVIKNFASPAGKMTQEDVDAIIDRVEKTLKESKKRPAKK
jgi:hypothetical protein